MYFTLKELCKSKKSEELRIDNFPSFEIVDHLGELVTKFLDPLRAAWGSAILVNSGFRCAILNAAVGGVLDSVHMVGYAVDIVPKNGQFDQFCVFIKNWVMKTGVKFDQIIIEKDTAGNRWVHIGLYNQKGQQRGRIFNLTKI